MSWQSGVVLQPVKFLTVSYQLENQEKRAIQKDPIACADQNLNQMVEEKYDISEWSYSMCRLRIISNGGRNKHHKATHKLLHKNTFTKPTMHGTERNRLPRKFLNQKNSSTLSVLMLPTPERSVTCFLTSWFLRWVQLERLCICNVRDNNSNVIQFPTIKPVACLLCCKREWSLPISVLSSLSCKCYNFLSRNLRA